jgi:methylthioribose-1-phosphate isomerase
MSCRYKRGELQLLDQLKLPFEFEYIPIMNCEESWKAIRAMNVRGAPAIAIAAALALAVEAVSAKVRCARNFNCALGISFCSILMCIGQVQPS